MKVIFLIMIGLSVLNAEIIRDSDGIITDTSTNLQWQDDTVGSYMTWEAAINYCESLTLGVHSDWRLPNINELKSIVDKSKLEPSIVDGFVNTNTDPGYYWSSTTSEREHISVWRVRFVNGVSSYGHKGVGTGINTRCVRDGE